MLLIFLPLLPHFLCCINICCRYKPLKPKAIQKRIKYLIDEFNRLNNGHSGDPTGARAEDHPLWYGKWKDFIEWKADNNRSSQAQQQREALRTTNSALGTEQRPLGPGAPEPRTEIGRENAPQERGPEGAGEGLEVRPMSNDNDSSNNNGNGQGGSTRTNNGQGGATRNRGRNRRRNKRPRSSSEDDYDVMEDHRNNIGALTDNLANIVQASMMPEQPANPYANNPIGGLQVLSQEVIALGASAQTSPVKNLAEQSRHALLTSMLTQIQNIQQQQQQQQPMQYHYMPPHQQEGQYMPPHQQEEQETENSTMPSLNEPNQYHPI